MNINAWKFAILNTWNWIFQNIPKIHFLCTIYGIMKWLASAWLILISKSASYPNRNANQNWRASFLLCEGRLRLCQKLTFFSTHTAEPIIFCTLLQSWIYIWLHSSNSRILVWSGKKWYSPINFGLHFHLRPILK